jgi:hypothetical protein
MYGKIVETVLIFFLLGAVGSQPEQRAAKPLLEEKSAKRTVCRSC